MPTVFLQLENGGIKPPDAISVSPGDQKITWVFPTELLYDSEPITFSQPPGYTKWPGTPHPKMKNFEVTVNTNKILHPGEKQKYKYNIGWLGPVPGEIDPDIENGAGGPEGKHHPHAGRKA